MCYLKESYISIILYHIISNEYYDYEKLWKNATYMVTLKTIFRGRNIPQNSHDHLYSLTKFNFPLKYLVLLKINDE